MYDENTELSNKMEEILEKGEKSLKKERLKVAVDQIRVHNNDKVPFHDHEKRLNLPV